MKVDTLIIGAGLSGLAAAARLHESGQSFLILEASDAVGGRVGTETVDGFLIDRGFQVFLDAYPESSALLNLEQLDLRAFEPGALVWKGGKLHCLMDVFRRPDAFLSSLAAPIGTLSDKWRVVRLRERFRKMPVEQIWTLPEQSTLEFLKGEGFSREMIDLFFRGFYGGIFLEDELTTSARMFAFTFGMFARGRATLPASGMKAIPEQLASRLPPGSIRLSCPVRKIEGKSVRTDEEEFTAKQILLATDATQASILLKKSSTPAWRRTASLSFSADESPYSDRLIALRGDRKGIIHHLTVPSNVAPTYSPDTKSLVSVTLVGNSCEGAGLESQVRRELLDWFGPATATWRLLRIDSINEALPANIPFDRFPPKVSDGIYIAGDHVRNASIEGAIGSGIRAAENILGDCIQKI
ncbi:MAG: FAD-dependent oxidoreductase [Verrucomicrobiae bacterium]|nr:FAD-dependent oxidoreductase [Verrucomicrobiae bacterium]